MCLQVQIPLQPSTPFLPNLKELRLIGLNLKNFPDVLGPCLVRLTALNFSHNNLKRLPMAMALFTSLKALDLSENILQLYESDMHLLTASSDLRTLAVLSQGTNKRGWRSESERGLSKDSLNHLKTFSKRFPDVKLQ